MDDSLVLPSRDGCLFLRRKSMKSKGTTNSSALPMLTPPTSKLSRRPVISAKRPFGRYSGSKGIRVVPLGGSHKSLYCGFDHGVGHPLLLLCHAKAPNYRKHKAFNDLAYYAEWPKVADAMIEAATSDPQSARAEAVCAHRRTSRRH